MQVKVQVLKISYRQLAIIAVAGLTALGCSLLYLGIQICQH